MKKTIYTVALVEDTEGNLISLNWYEKKPMSLDEVSIDKAEEINAMYEEFGKHKVKFFLRTSDKASWLSARIKCESAALKSMVAYHDSLLGQDAEIDMITHDVAWEVQQVSVRRLGRLVRRLIRKNLEAVESGEPVHWIEDELAIQCYNVIEAERVAKDELHKIERQFSEKYDRIMDGPDC